MIKWKNIAISISCIIVLILVMYALLSKNEKSTVTIEKVNDSSEKEKIIEDEYKEVEKKESADKPCCRRDENMLIGKIKSVKNPPSSLSWLEKRLPFVKHGGRWEPQHCRPGVKVAIIVPYRERLDNLLVFLRHIHPILNRQQLHYQLFIVEQSETDSFNKGKLQNIGFKEALKYDDFDCFVFHDVDLMPEDDRNYYGCPTSPRHMSPALDKFNYEMYSPEVFGGVVAYSKKDFIDLNGYSNSFYGVEGENEDMYARIFHKQKKLTRPVMEIGRYSMLTHKRTIKQKGNVDKQQRDKISHEDTDGLKTLRYKVKHNEKYKLFTLIKVDLLWNKKEAEAF